MLKIVYPICCGMDVHKNFLVACIAITDDKGITTYKSKRFSTYSFNAGVTSVLRPLIVMFI